jgi:hypothetical protein
MKTRVGRKATLLLTQSIKIEVEFVVKKFGIKKIRYFVVAILLTLVLSNVQVAFGGDLGDGFYLHNVDPYSDVLSVNISSTEMSRILNSSNGPDGSVLAKIARTFYVKFNDEYDFLVMICYSNLADLGNPDNLIGYSTMVNNDATGIGLPMGALNNSWGLPSKLGSIALLDREDMVFRGMLLHEIAHQWITFIFPTEINSLTSSLTTYQLGGHWGLSNAGGVIGGFKEVRNMGGNRYQASISPNSAGFGLTSNTEVPFSDIELYLMGFKSAQELRDAGFRLDIYTGGNVDSLGDLARNGIFYATGVKSYTIDDIIAQYGERNPAPQRNFKAAVIALTDGSITPNYSRLVAGLRWFAGGMNDNSNKDFPDAPNFAQATSGRGTIEIEGLRAGGGTPTITTTNLAGGTVGTAYSQTLGVSGTGSVAWTLDNGNLPDGLALNPNTGEISGTPTVANTFNFTVKATNTVGNDTKPLSIIIASGGGNPGDNNNGSGGGGCNAGYGLAGLLLLAGFVTCKFRLTRSSSPK